MAERGSWIDLTARVHLGSGAVRGSAPGEMSLWDAAATEDMKAASEALANLRFGDYEKEDYLKVLDIKIASVPNAGLIDDEVLTVRIKVPKGTVVVHDPVHGRETIFPKAR
jgi:hypothetical protein